MVDNNLHFGIVGPGSVAQLHCRAIHQARGAEAISVCGRNAGRTEIFAAQHGLIPYTDFDAFISNPEIDAISIATASGAHLEAGIRAARKGKHVLCEKPLEVTSSRAAALIAACAKAGVRLGVYFQARMDDCTQVAKNAIDQGRLGQLLFASCQMRWFRSQDYYDSAAWRGTRALDGGGCLMNQGIHTLDLLVYLAGMPKTVSAFQGPVTHQRIEVEDNLCASIRFANGAVGTIEASTSCAPGFPRRVDISGETGSIGIEDNRIVRWSFLDQRPEDEDIIRRFKAGSDSVGGASDPTAIDVNGHCLLVEDFSRSVFENRDPLISGVEAKKAVDVVCAVYDSLDLGQTVTLL